MFFTISGVLRASIISFAITPVFIILPNDSSTPGVLIWRIISSTDSTYVHAHSVNGTRLVKRGLALSQDDMMKIISIYKPTTP